MQTLAWLALTVLLASCAPVEVVKEARSSPPPPDPPKRDAPAEPGDPTPEPGDPTPATEDRAASARADAAFFEWVEQAEPACRRRRDPEAYLPPREGVSAEDVEIVKARCAAAAELGSRGAAWQAALSACVDRFVKAIGAGKPACRIAPADVPDVPPSLFEKHVAGCSATCEQAGPEALALRKERSQKAWCCDGTRSPSCTYEKLYPGCCAGHGGVCIE